MDFRDSSMKIGNARLTPLPQHRQQDIVDESLINSMNGAWAIHVDKTHVVSPPPTLPPTTFGLSSASYINGDNSNLRNRMLTDMLTPLLHHHETANFRDLISTYLKLPSDLWQALCSLRESTFAHEVLRDNLPPGLWQLIAKLREELHFEAFQPYAINIFAEQTAFMIPMYTHSRSASGGAAGRPALHPSHATSPGNGGFQFSSPPGGGPDNSTYTRSVTPVSVIYSSSRNNSRSPWRNKKGKAPLGQLYVCPSSNCTKKGFKNVGNYVNHMLRLHAEYPRHDPETSLRLESSPPVDNGEEFVSPAATTASNSPLLVRHLSQDWSNFGEMHTNLGQDNMHQLTGYGLNNTGNGTSAERFDLSSSFNSDSGAATNTTNDHEQFGSVADQSQTSSARDSCEFLVDEDAEEPANEDGNLSFGMFQATIMSARRSNRNRRSH